MFFFVSVVGLFVLLSLGGQVLLRCFVMTVPIYFRELLGRVPVFWCFRFVSFVCRGFLGVCRW